MGERLNFYGSLLALTGCLLFIGVYTAMPYVTGRERWWHSHIGRLLVTKAAALAGLMAIVVSFYVWGIDVEWIRSARGVLAAAIGVMMMYQSWLVYRIQREQGDNGS